MKDLDLNKIEVIDLRDYNESSKDLVEGAINIPFAYLKRFNREIPKDRDIILIVSSRIDKNIGARYLRSKGYRIVGCTNVNQNKVVLIKKSR